MTEQASSAIPLPIETIRAFCERWGVREFALFGSVLREDFSAESDVDVLLKFREDVRYSLFDLVRMGDELETIFGREVDIVDRLAVEKSRNNIRRRAILNNAQVIYAA